MGNLQSRFLTHLITNGFVGHPYKMQGPRRNTGICRPYRPPSLFLPPALTNPGRVYKEKGAPLTNSFKLIGCSLGTAVNICMCVCRRVYEDRPELGPI